MAATVAITSVRQVSCSLVVPAFTCAGPADDERHAMAAFPMVALHAAPRSRAVVGVVGAHVDDAGGFGAVVAGEDDERVVRDAELFEVPHQFADDVVELDG